MLRVRVGGGVDQLGGLVDLEQAEVAAAGDVEQDAGGALDGLLQQRARRWRSWPPRWPATPRRRCRCPSARMPAFSMIARTSAKSRLIRPGIVIRSVMPWTPWRRTLSASRKASRMLVRRSTMPAASRWGSRSACRPSRAGGRCPPAPGALRCEPSKANGRVTTPTVSAPISFLAISAITGAAPVPVPPPSPAVTNTMSAPLSASLMSSRDSAAAPCPICGLAPAPRPLVRVAPMWSFRSDVRHLERLRVRVGRDEFNAR